MKLLSALEVKTEVVKRQESEAVQLARVTELLNTKTKQLNELEASGQARLAAIDRQVAVNEAAMMSKLSELKKEVKELEERRKEALKPLEGIRSELLRNQQRQNEQAQLLESKERQLERFRARLKRLDDRLEDREYAVADLEIDIAKRLKDLVAKEQVLKNSEQSFNQRLLEANEAHLKRDAELSEKEAVLTAGLEWTARREKSLAEEKQELEEKARALTAQEVRLAKHFKTLKDKGLL